MKTKNSYYKAACVRPPKADALITINGLGFNTREAGARKSNAQPKQTVRTTAVRLDCGEWRSVEPGAFGDMPTLESGRHVEAAAFEQKKWTRYQPDCGLSKGEWLRRRAAHLHKVRNVATRAILAGGCL